ncbi:MAG: 30S ribosomal protein S17 [Candidatus Eisenbacteria bacterium]|jgi:small subunit ribosomal protein S17|nr:30S ribosomal protein S17 [Candidatus Eisenbacteria bacterium]
MKGKVTQKTREGVVVGDRADKTIRVEVERVYSHRLYGKKLRSKKVFAAHDEKNECKAGDRVRIRETRPLSKTKRWRLLEILERAK